MVSVKSALTPPAGMTMLVGTGAVTASVVDKVTVAPPSGAGFASTTVPVTASPPTTELGVSFREATELTAALGFASRASRPAPLNEPHPVALS